MNRMHILMAIWGLWSCVTTIAAEADAISRPSADISMSFVRPGRIAEMPVRQGQTVEAGDVLLRLDSKVESCRVRQLELQASELAQVKAAEAEYEQKQEDLKKIQMAHGKGAATDWELEHARLEAKIAEFKQQNARFEHEMAQLKYAESKAEYEQMELKSPIRGQIEQILVEVGEGAETLKPVVRLVQVDPLWIDVAIPMKDAIGFRHGQELTVRFPSASGKSPAESKGRIVDISAVGEAASETLRVRLEVPNPSLRPAGERVSIMYDGEPSQSHSLSSETGAGVADQPASSQP